MNKNDSKNIHIGTSGWHYDHWIGPFYPEKFPKKDFLDFYSENFKTVEINNSFYRLPLEKTFENWRDRVSDDFVFSVKASRYITHIKRLKEPEKSLKQFFERVLHLRTKLGAILFQLPPRFGFDGNRLQEFLKALPENYKYAFEFRDPSWLNPEVFDMLSDYGIALCLHELGTSVAPRMITTKFVYVRLHGPGGPYEGKYSFQELDSWAKDVTKWIGEGMEIFCYFDNDQYGYAPENAKQLLQMVQ
jgi:uncharacterized protein YecE (DUF72 family)